MLLFWHVLAGCEHARTRDAEEIRWFPQNRFMITSMRNNTPDIYEVANEYSPSSLPLLEPRLLRRALHTVAFGNIPEEHLNGASTAADHDTVSNAKFASLTLARSNLRLVLKHLQTYRSDVKNEDEWDALVHVGYKALLEETKKYDLRHSSGAKYQTYAMYKVRQATYKEFDDSRKLIKNMKKRVVSLDQSVMSHSGENFSLLDVLADKTSELGHSEVEDKLDVSEFMTILSGREREVMTLYYRVNENSTEDDHRSFVEVGEMIGLSGEATRKIAQNGIHRILNYVRSNEGYGVDVVLAWEDLELKIRSTSAVAVQQSLM